MAEKLQKDFEDPVEGPTQVDTIEQVRTRSTHAHEERQEDLDVRSADSGIPTLTQNLRYSAGVDDRGAEDRDR